MKISGAGLIVVGCVFIVIGTASAFYFLGRIKPAEKIIRAETSTRLYQEYVNPFKEREAAYDKVQITMMKVYGYGGYVVVVVGLAAVICGINRVVFMRKIIPLRIFVLG